MVWASRSLADANAVQVDGLRHPTMFPWGGV